MSEIAIKSVLDRDTGRRRTTDQVLSGALAQWGRFGNDAVPAGSFNIGSSTDTGVGQLTFTPAAPLLSTESSSGNVTAFSSSARMNAMSVAPTSTIARTFDTSGVAADGSAGVYVSVHGRLA